LYIHTIKYRISKKKITVINERMSICHNFWKQTDVCHQTRASKSANVSICCAVRPAHHPRIFSGPSTHGVLALEKKLSDFRAFRISEFRIRDTELCNVQRYQNSERWAVTDLGTELCGLFKSNVCPKEMKKSHGEPQSGVK